MMNTTIKRKSLADEVAAKLQQQIALGKFKEHEKLPVEPELMKAFGVGRSTIREAVKILVNSGLLRVQQGLGTFVEKTTGIKESLTQRLKRSDIKNLDEVRQLLEMKIAEKAAAKRTPADIKKIKHWLDTRKNATNANELEKCIDADIQFHTAIAEASKNDILADLYKAFAVQLKDWFMQVHTNVSAFKDTQKLHEQLLKSIETGDTKKAWQVASEIISYDER